MEPRRLSRHLRHDRSPRLRRRRIVLALSLVSSGCMALVSLYQFGLIRRLPEPPLAGFDGEAVNGSSQSYSFFSTPDAVLGLASYAGTAVLAAMGPERRHPAVPVALAGKALADAAAALKLTWDQAFRHRAFCFWCLLAAGCTVATVPLALPEARDALRGR